MAHLITQLCRGNIDPMRYLGCGNSEIKKLETLIERNQIKLEADLPEEKKVISEKLYDCYEEYLAILTEQAFCDGFCLGSRLCAEALLETEQSQ